jgi:hypothetical protein
MRTSLAAMLTAVCLAPPLAGQGRAPAKPPTISARSFTSGNATVKVTGAFRIDAVVPINTQASVADGEMTWLQFGASGSKDPNALITVSSYEVGVSAGQGKQIFTAGAEDCRGKITVTAAAVVGEYTCKGITAYDGGSGKMSTVDVVISFTAGS